MWYAGSDVMGCRRPTGGVFSYVSSDRVTLRAFAVATPRGRSSSSHEGEPKLHSVIYVLYMYVLKTAVMMLKIHRNNLQFNRYSHKKHILHCNNFSNFTVYLIIPIF